MILADFGPLLSGGVGAILVSTVSKVWLSKAARYEKEEEAKRLEREMLISIMHTQAESIGFMKSDIAQLRRDLEECDTRHAEASRTLQKVESKVDRMQGGTS